MRALALVLLLTCSCGGVLAIGGSAVIGGGIGYAHGTSGTRSKDTQIGAAVAGGTVAVLWLAYRIIDAQPHSDKGFFESLFGDCWNVGQGCGPNSLLSPRQRTAPRGSL